MPSDDTPSVGAMLRAARERQGLTVNDIADRTFIRSTLIRDIEVDDFTGCGLTFYARGHVRSIALAVGLDPDLVLKEFNVSAAPELPTEALPIYRPAQAAPLPSRRPQAPAQATAVTASSASPRRGTPVAPALPAARVRNTADHPTAATATAKAPPRRPTPSRSDTRRAPRPRKSSRWVAALVAAACVVALLAGARFLFGPTNDPAQPPEPGRTVPSSSPTAAEATPSSSASRVVPPPTGVNVQIQASGSSWIRVTDANGKEVFQGVLEAGDVKDFKDPRSLTVRFGNSGAVRVRVNGIDQGTPSCGAAVCSETYKPAAAG